MLITAPLMQRVNSGGDCERAKINLNLISFPVGHHPLLLSSGSSGGARVHGYHREHHAASRKEC